MTCYSLPTLALARDAVDRGLAAPLREGLAVEADLNTLAFQTADAVEGMTAFREKREPVFRDR
jgi:enoyl-CoA hydratase